VVSLAVLAAVGVGAWYAHRAWTRSEERDAALKLARDGRHGEALPALTAVLARDPDDADVLEAVIVARVRTEGLRVDLEPDLDRLCALRPDDPAPFRVRAELRNRMSRKDDALADALRVLELAPDDHAVRKFAAWLAVELGKRDVAERELGKLLADSKYPKAELGTRLALARWQAGDLAGARAALDEHAPPGAAAGLVLRGVLDYEAGRFEQAVAELRAADPADDGERQFALNYLGLALARLGRADESREAFDRLHAHYRAVRYAEDAGQRPGDMAAQVRAARANLAVGKPAEAAHILEQALARIGEDAEARAVLAEATEALRKRGPKR
jgi:tetratricopeptide (TPR) repeat protein